MADRGREKKSIKFMPNATVPSDIRASPTGLVSGFVS